MTHVLCGHGWLCKHYTHSFSVLPSYQLDNREALTVQLDPAVPLFKVYIKVGLFWGGTWGEGWVKGNLVYTFCFTHVLSHEVAWQRTGAPSPRAKAVLPHNLPSYFEMGCKWKTKESATDATYRALGKCYSENPGGSSPAAKPFLPWLCRSLIRPDMQFSCHQSGRYGVGCKEMILKCKHGCCA